MPQVFLLLKGPKDHAAVCEVATELFEGTPAPNTHVWVDHESHDVMQSAEKGTRAAYRILRREGYINRSILAEYTLNGPPMNIHGSSADLAFAIAFATEKLSRNQFKPIAATGELIKNGSIGAVKGIINKLGAALHVLPAGGQCLYPEANEGEVPAELIRRAAELDIKLIPVNRLDEALSQLDIELRKVYLKSPFRGLEAFQFEHAGIYFGRSVEIDEVCERLKARAEGGNPSVLVVGASGSGKSSLVQAGVLPELVNGRTLPTDVQVRWGLFRPRDALAVTGGGAEASVDEAQRLMAAILASWCQRSGLGVGLPVVPDLTAGWDADRLVDWLQGALESLPRQTAPVTYRFVWVVDQLEEFFSLPFQPESVKEFGDLLNRLTKCGVWVLLTMRSDYYDRYQNQPSLVRCLENNGTYDLLPARPEAIEQMITGPAMVAELSYERNEKNESLAARILQDVGRESGTLPLLEFMLSELYDRRDKASSTLLWRTYETIGGLKGAIKERAEEVFKKCSRDEKSALPGLIRLLVDVSGSEGKKVASRPAPINLVKKDMAQWRLAIALRDKHLLVMAGSDEGQTVRLSHEALLLHWKRASEQVAREQELLQKRHRMEEAEKLYSNATSKSDKNSLLLSSGLPLEEGRELVEQWQDSLTPQVKNYVKQSVHAHRRRKNLRLLGVVAICLTGFILTAIVVQSKNAAEAQRDKAWIIESELLAEEAWRKLENGEIKSAVSLALKALPDSELTQQRPYVSSAESVLYKAVLGYVPADLSYEHSSSVKNLLFNDKDTTVVSTYGDGSTKVWDANENVLVHSLEKHLSEITHADISKDGSMVLTASRDHRIHVWSKEANKITKLIGHSGGVLHSTFSEDGAWVASGSLDNTVRLWNSYDGDQVAKYVGHSDSVIYVGFYADDSKIVSVSADGSVRTWSTKTLGAYDPNIDYALNAKEVAPYLGVGFEAIPDSLAETNGLAKNEGVLVTKVNSQSAADTAGIRVGDIIKKIDDSKVYIKIGSANTHGLTFGESIDSKDIGDIIKIEILRDNNNVELNVKLGWRGGVLLSKLSERTVAATSAIVSREGDALAVGYKDGILEVFDLNAGTRLTKVNAHGQSIDVIEIDSEGKFVVTASSEGSVKIWRLSGDVLLNAFSTDQSPISDLSLSKEGNLVMASSLDGLVRLWDIYSGELISTLRPSQGASNQSIFMENKNEVLTGSRDGLVQRYISSSPQIKLSSEHKQVIIHATFSDETRRLLTVSDIGLGEVWDTKKSVKLYELVGHIAPIEYGVFNRDGELIATVSADHTARIWDARTGNIKRVLKGHSDRLTFAAFSPDSKKLVTVSDDFTVRLWDLDNGRELAVLDKHTGEVLGAIFSEDGDKILTYSKDGSSKIWQPIPQSSVLDMKGQSGVINANYISRGKQVVTVTEKGAVQIWSVETAASNGILFSADTAITRASLSSDGETMALGLLDGRILLCDMRTGKQEPVVFENPYEVLQMSFTHNNRRLVTLGLDNVIRIWDRESGRIIRRLPLDPRIPARYVVDKGGQSVVTISKGNEIAIWEDYDVSDELINYAEQTTRVFNAPASVMRKDKR